MYPKAEVSAQFNLSTTPVIPTVSKEASTLECDGSVSKLDSRDGNTEGNGGSLCALTHPPSHLLESQVSSSPTSQDRASCGCTSFEIDEFIESAFGQLFKELRGSLHSGCQGMAKEAFDKGHSLKAIEDQFIQLCTPMAVSAAEQTGRQVLQRWPNWEGSIDLEARMIERLRDTVRFWMSDLNNQHQERSSSSSSSGMKGLTKRGMAQPRKKDRR